ncbi:MAG: 3-demethylubiquinone-9 3-O-methyltransferase [Holosporaceae bacterium]|nr:MAG: 3-demethylubiquinone-9 3-O-methyltransferase [Holosporaceae bacterium]
MIPQKKNIEIARQHAHALNLKIPYHTAPIEALPDDKTYQVVVALEVVEHLNCPHHFLLECHKKLRPGGLLIISTLNRTMRSYLEAIISAEYILSWAPKGTHSWSQFHKPSELHNHMKKIGFYDVSFQGLSYAPLQDKWTLSDTLEVNYFAKAVK